jgi:predicted transcriptional regulator of viral defense system
MRNNAIFKKTLGPLSSYLISELKKANKNIFRLKDAQSILNKTPQATADLLSELVKKEIILRLKPGLFLIVPLEADKNYLENRYIVAKELIYPHKYYISHYSAMAIHGMTTQPVFKVFIASSKRRKNRIISGQEFIFLYTQPYNFFGIEDKWITKQDKVKVSDLEKTIVDALARPQLCGGVSEIAKGIWLKKQNINYHRLLNYCHKTRVKAVAKRLGFILETLNLIDNDWLTKLRDYIEDSKAYILLEPGLKRQSRYLERWRLLINFNPEELKSIIWT